MVKKKITICFVGNLSYTFIKNDYRTLSQRFNIHLIEPPKTKLDWIKYKYYLLKAVKHCDLTFSWFAGWHSLTAVIFSKMFRKKSIVVAGGYDASYHPEIDYGAFTNLKEKIPAKYVLKNADIILAVSEFTKKEILKKVKPKQIEVVYNGIDTDKFKPVTEKENVIITIGDVTKLGVKLKGLDTFVKVSGFFPNFKFVIIGKTEKTIVNKLKKSNSKVIFTEKLPHKEVLKWLQRAKIYCQLSYIESFGIGVAESMSCGCIPIVTKKGSLPEIVGDTGFFVPYNDEKATIEAIKKAVNISDDVGEKTRARINEIFTYGKRKEKLENIAIETMNSP